MQLSKGFIAHIATVISTSTAGLATASHAPRVLPILNNVSPSAETALGDLVLTNDFIQESPGVEGSQQAYFDPIRLEYVVELRGPEGGFEFACDTPDEDFTVYGFAVVYGNPDKLAFLKLFDEPIVIHAGQADQTIPLGDINFPIPASLGE